MKRDYREKTINGYMTDGMKFTAVPVTVRMTSDDRGKSLSLTAADILQIGIPLEEVTEIIVLAKKEEHP